MCRTGRHYNKEQDAYILANYGTMYVGDIAEYVGTTKKSVWRRASALGLKRPYKRWTPEEDEVIRSAWERFEQQVPTAEKLGRNAKELAERAKKLGCTPWRRKLLIRYGRPCVTLEDGNVVLEHRHVASQILGRPLTSSDFVHHIDFDKFNNDPSNLHVFASVSAHRKCHTQFEHFVSELFRRGIIEFDRTNGVYRLCETDK
jgi:hypothetical protein